MTSTLHFTQNSITNDTVILFQNIGLHWITISRRSFNNRQISDSQHRHVKGTRNWRSGQGQDIYLFFQFFQGFLMLDTKSLFLINNHQAQISKHNIFRQNTMCSNQNINLTVFQFFKCCSLLFFTSKATQHININCKILESFLKIRIVLLR